MIVYVVEGPEETDSVWASHDAAAEQVKRCVELEIKNALGENDFIREVWAYGDAGDYWPKDGEIEFPDVPVSEIRGAGVVFAFCQYEWHITEMEVQEG